MRNSDSKLINAKVLQGASSAQGQNLTLGAGARYNINSRFAVSAGLNWMHISNANLAALSAYNCGINAYGPVFGLDVLLRGHRRESE